jgi:HlyD family secretion protein
MEATEHAAAVIRANIADNTLLAPVDGRIQYKLTNVGEVLGTGGKVYTMIDTSYLYMDVFLPTSDASRVPIGAEARIVLDATPSQPMPAHVSMVAAQNQFTPKIVETKTERDRLMFRVRVKVDAEWLRPRVAAFHSGIPGLAYVKLDQATAWPAALKDTL